MPTSTEHEPSPEVRARVLALVRERPSLRRSAVRRQVAALSIAALAVPLLAFVAVGGIDRGQRPWELVAITACGSLVLALAAIRIVLGPGPRTLGPPHSWLLAISIMAPLALLLWKLSWGAAYGEVTLSWTERPGLRCFALSFVFGLWPLLAFALAQRRSDPVHPASLGAAIGAACGLWAGTLVDLWCPVSATYHVLLGHALPIVLLALGGGWLGARILSLRQP
jgi:hypothetical protein